jgi:DNA-directed RNA polymerase specialized sigma24 family protein
MVDPKGEFDMDVRRRGPQGTTPTRAPRTPNAGSGRLLTREQVERILGKRQDRELRIARSFVECRRLTDEQLEDLYQQTVLALLPRPYKDEKHLCGALRLGIKQRALNLYHSERRRGEILAENAPAMHALEVARSAELTPEQVALARQDRLLITEFLAELTREELEVFLLVTEGKGFNRIAKELEMPVNQTRNVVAACERKRELFQRLHDGGRLCGYRATTITALLDGQATSDELAKRAIAHVAGCAQCRAEHKTNAHRLRRAFEEQAAALLPPVLAGHLGGLSRASMHARTLASRIRPDWVSLAQDGARERAVALLAGGGASAKLAAAVITAAVIAGSTIAATHTPRHQRPPRAHALTRPVAAPLATRPVAFVQTPLAPFTGIAAQHAHQRRSRAQLAPGRVVAVPHPARRRPATREPGGFAYLGVPTTSTAAASAQASAPPATATSTQTGGPFSP